MIFVIMPLVQEARQNAVRAAIYAVSLIGTAVVFFGALSSVGSTWHGARLAVVNVLLSVALTGYALREAGTIRLPLLTSVWQVPRAWSRLDPMRAGVLYGALMGLGFPTRAPFASYHAIVLWTILVGDLGFGIAVGGAFGVGRAIALVLPRLRARRQNVDGYVERTEWLFHRVALVRTVNAVALSVVAAGVLTAAVRAFHS